MCTVPRLLGLRLHTLGVIASNGCSGCPNAGSDSGCTCHSMFAWVYAGLLRAKQPRVEGGIVIGPLRCRANCSPIIMRVRGLRYKLFTVLPGSVSAGIARTGDDGFNHLQPCTLYTMRSCKWSCRFSPTPSLARLTRTPAACSTRGGPIPLTCIVPIRSRD